MRALEISLFIIMIQASVIFVNSTNLFATNYAASPSNAYTQYNTSQISQGVEDPNNLGLLDWFWISVRWIFDSLFVILKVVLAVVLIWPWLVFVFHVPVELATLLQVGIYIIYWLGYASWKSNRPVDWHI
jgi:hypothetical protein